MACIVVLYAGCRKVPKYSNVPNIEYKSITQYRILDKNASTLPTDSVFADSVTIGIHFEDGNGDLGYPADQVDTTDYFVDYYRKTNGVFHLITFTPPFNGNMPLLAPIGTVGPLEGDLYYSMVIDITTDPVTCPPDDTVRFVIKIMDRAGNVSNSVDTGPVIFNKTL